MPYRYNPYLNDMRPFIGAGWWQGSMTPYNKDGSVGQQSSQILSNFYIWMVLKPTTNREAIIISGLTLAIGFVIVVLAL